MIRAPNAAFEIRFQSLFDEGRALAFPCDARGQVDLDNVSERTRNNYLFARAMVGREYAMPKVLESTLAPGALISRLERSGL